MIDIPVNAEVRCSDGPAGRSAYVIVNPINQLLDSPGGERRMAAVCRTYGPG